MPPSVEFGGVARGALVVGLPRHRRGIVAVQRRHRRAPHQPQRDRRPRRQPLGQRERLGIQRIVGNDLVDQPPTKRLLRAHALAQQHHLGRPRPPDQAGQHPARAAIGHQSDVDERLQEIGGLARDAEIRRQCQAAPDARRWPAHRTDDRHCQMRDGQQGRIVMLGQRRIGRLSGIGGAQRAARHVRARTEPPSGPGDHHGPRAIQLCQRRANLVEGGGWCRVQPVGTVQRDDQHVAAPLAQDMLIGHAFRLLSGHGLGARRCISQRL